MPEAGLAAIMENKEATTVTNKHFEHALKGISRGITRKCWNTMKNFQRKVG